MLDARPAHRGGAGRPAVRCARHRRARRRRHRAGRAHHLRRRLRPRRATPHEVVDALGRHRGRPRRDGRLRHHPLEADPRRVPRPHRQHPSRAAPGVQGLARGRRRARRRREGHRLHRARRHGSRSTRVRSWRRRRCPSSPTTRSRRCTSGSRKSSGGSIREVLLEVWCDDPNARSRRALLSVYDKTGIVEFARELHDAACDLVSSGGTAKAIADAGIPVTEVDDITGVPPDPRPPRRHAAPEGPRRDPRRPLASRSHDDDMAHYGIEPFDLVVSNLYPFARATRGIETDRHRRAGDGARGGEEPRVRRRSSPTASQYAPLLEELDANGNTVGDDTAPRLRAHGVRAAPPRSTPQIVAWFDRTDDDAAAATSTSRSSAPARRCATARTRTSSGARYRDRRARELVGRRRAARRPRAQLPQPLRRRRRVAAGARPRH